MGDHVATTRISTQAKHPWRAAIRTTFQVLVALAAAAPLIYAAFTLQDPLSATGAVGTFLGSCAGVTRVMNTPVVEAFIKAYLPWLAAEPQA